MPKRREKRKEEGKGVRCKKAWWYGLWDVVDHCG